MKIGDAETSNEEIGREEGELIQTVDRLGRVYQIDGISFRIYQTSGECGDRVVRFTSEESGCPVVVVPARQAS